MGRKIFIFILFLVLVIFSMSTISAQKSIQIQPSSDGTIEASLIEAKVQRGVLTVKVVLRNISKEWIEPEISFNDAYYTDIDANKKYFGLKDSNGNLIAGPASYNWGGGTFKEKIAPNGRKIIWIKFPAPPETTKIIDIFIPKILPFEEINVKK